MFLYKVFVVTLVSMNTYAPKVLPCLCASCVGHIFTAYFVSMPQACAHWAPNNICPECTENCIFWLKRLWCYLFDLIQLLCNFQVVAAFMMMQTLNKTGFQAFSMSIPSVGELFQIFEIAAPVFVTMTSKVLWRFLIYL